MVLVVDCTGHTLTVQRLGLRLLACYKRIPFQQPIITQA